MLRQRKSQKHTSSKYIYETKLEPGIWSLGTNKNISPTIGAIRMGLKPRRKTMGMKLVGTSDHELHGLFFCLKILQANSTNLFVMLIWFISAERSRRRTPMMTFLIALNLNTFWHNGYCALRCQLVRTWSIQSLVISHYWMVYQLINHAY